MVRAQRDAYSPAEEALLARLEGLSGEFAVRPDDDFRAATRGRLVAMAAVRTPATAATRRPPVRAGRLRGLLGGTLPGSWRTRVTAGLAGAALTVTALGGLLGAAQGARPGDLLYDLKRGGEQTQLALAGDSRRGLTLLGFASTRLDEVGDLVGVQPNADAVVGTTPSGGEAGLAAGPDVDLVTGTLQTMDRQTTEGTAAVTARAVQDADPGSLEVLSGWAADQRSGIGDLSGAVPTGARDALDSSRALVEAVAARSSALQDALGCAGGASTAGADELGPVPAACPPAPPTTASASSSPSAGGSSDTAGTGGFPRGAVSGAPATGSAPATGTAAPTPTTGAAPTTGSGGAPATSAPPAGTPSRAVPVPSLPVPSLPVPSLPVPSLPVPSLPVPSLPVPSLPVPSLSLPGQPPPSTGSPGAAVSLPPVVPGVPPVCLPPVVTVGC